MFIKRAAILYEKGEILEGHDYSNIQALARKLGIAGNSINGFVDSADNFIDAIEALKIAMKANQVPEDYEGPLHPEDIFKGVEYAID